MPRIIKIDTAANALAVSNSCGGSELNYDAWMTYLENNTQNIIDEYRVVPGDIIQPDCAYRNTDCYVLNNDSTKFLPTIYCEYLDTGCIIPYEVSEGKDMIQMYGEQLCSSPYFGVEVIPNMFYTVDDGYWSKWDYTVDSEKAEQIIKTWKETGDTSWEAEYQRRSSH